MTYNINNPILNTDSYKYSHYLQYPPGTRQVSTYIEPRWPRGEDLMFFGLQMYLKEYLSRRITYDDVDEAEQFVETHVPGLAFNRCGFARIVEKHNGYYPLRIQAIPEGTVHSHGITQVQVTNTDIEFPWLPTFIETALVRAAWLPVNVATVSFMGKKILKKWMLKTCDNLDSLNFKLHDFGGRGATCNEAAGIGGVSHLVNFRGTDTVMGVAYANKYYNEKMAGFSIPASEHSTMTSWLRDGETLAYQNMLKQFGGPGKMFAMVLDSYDVHDALENIIGGTMKDAILASGVTIGLRLDSGNPVLEPARAMDILGAKFGFTTNSKDFKVLPSAVRIVQGDGVNLKMIDECCAEIARKGWSLDNIGTFGMGGELQQKHNRDTHGYADKCNAINRCDQDGWIDVSKSPVGSPDKASKAGRRAVIQHGNNGFKWLEDVREDSLTKHQIDHENVLRDVWVNGEEFNTQTLEMIRHTADSFL